MNDYSDLFFLIAAIAIYGLLVNNTNRALVLNNQILNDSEIEYGAISLAQDILDEARWMGYDEVSEGELEDLYDRELYSDDVAITGLSSSQCPSSKPCKRVEVAIQSDYLNNNDGTQRVIRMEMIKTDY